MIVAGTGHRPDKLGGWDNTSGFYKVVEVAVTALEEQNPKGVVSGVAAGWDLALAHAAMELDMHLLCAVPFTGQEKRWSNFWQQLYGEAMEYATEVRVLFEPDMSSKHSVVQALHGRNDWMVNYVKEKKGKILALWDGSKGGTAHCIRSADRAGVEVVNYWNIYSHNSHERQE